ncbi:hypothetical protein PHYSODRAFT_318794 [Phytophthora sojae]|uniref:HTH CENPB-type domain-containing protein n=1 Tax=Phytophthora sojae (strain P6497) TaxID=1094619 RepID=G5A6P3_PHYSP|nr:hypothetical protein PHYSODRAFT_318794 [Phytophthora sojae]EGZ08998.1 hypothetical protein PHYSODRAFT_318794 [Phytophthora sojae]|eukprot:XP_009535631.1 hypothetical protein PHYSODRAFT_318794 [Phytophthora sojae]
MTRPRTTGNDRGQRTYTPIPVDYRHKLKVLGKLAKGAEVGAVCDDGKGHLQNFRRSGDATIISADADIYIVLWLNTKRKEGCPVSAKMLELKALEVAADDGISRDVFSASYSWRRRFLRRHKLSIRARTRQGQTTPADAEAAQRDRPKSG